MACVLHDPTNEVDVAATDAQQSQENNLLKLVPSDIRFYG